jgi:hypothetical protein
MAGLLNWLNLKAVWAAMTVWQEAVVLFVGIFAVAQLELDHFAEAVGPAQPPQLVASAGAHGEPDVTVLVSDRKLARQVQRYRIERVRECDQLVPFGRHEVRSGGATGRIALADVFFDHQLSRACTVADTGTLTGWSRTGS